MQHVRTSFHAVYQFEEEHLLDKMLDENAPKVELFREKLCGLEEADEELKKMMQNLESLQRQFGEEGRSGGFGAAETTLNPEP